MKVKGLKNIFLANNHKKIAVVAIRQNRFYIKTFLKKEKRHYVLIKGSIHQEDETNIYVRCQSPKIHEANIDRMEARKRQFYSNS